MQGAAIEGYAVVSGDGMIADRNGHMPDGLKHEPDARFFRDGLDSAALVVHGRHSHEQQGPISDRRRRLVVTDRTPGLSAHSSIPNAWVWNPASIPFEEACRKIGVTEGKIAISGGTGVFGLFLKIGFCREGDLSSRTCRPRRLSRCCWSTASQQGRCKCSTLRRM